LVRGVGAEAAAHATESALPEHGAVHDICRLEAPQVELPALGEVRQDLRRGKAGGGPAPNARGPREAPRPGRGHRGLSAAKPTQKHARDFRRWKWAAGLLRVEPLGPVVTKDVFVIS